MKIKFFILDTNALISAALIQDSINAMALDKALKTGKLAISATIFRNHRSHSQKKVR